LYPEEKVVTSCEEEVCDVFVLDGVVPGLKTNFYRIRHGPKMANSHVEMKKIARSNETYDRIFIETPTRSQRLEVDLIPKDKSLITFEYYNRKLSSWHKHHIFDFSLAYYQSDKKNPNITGEHNSGFYSFSTTANDTTKFCFFDDIEMQATNHFEMIILRVKCGWDKSDGLIKVYFDGDLIKFDLVLQNVALPELSTFGYELVAYW